MLITDKNICACVTKYARYNFGNYLWRTELLNKKLFIRTYFCAIIEAVHLLI